VLRDHKEVQQALKEVQQIQKNVPLNTSSTLIVDLNQVQ